MARAESEFLLGDAIPSEYGVPVFDGLEFYGGWPDSQCKFNQSHSWAVNTLSGVEAGVCHSVLRHHNNYANNNLSLNAYVMVLVKISCEPGYIQPKRGVWYYGFCVIRNYAAPGSPDEVYDYYATYPSSPFLMLASDIDVVSQTSYCTNDDSLMCGTHSTSYSGYYAAATPATEVISLPSSTPSDEWSPARRVVEDMLAAAGLTVNLTSRHSCRPVACDCSSSLDGLGADFDAKTFTLGTESLITATGEFYERWEHTGNGPYYFHYDKYDLAFLFLYEQQDITVFCETDEEAVPPVDRWYVRFVSQCRTYDEQNNLVSDTVDDWIGTLNCYEAAECGELTAGTHVPLGSPTNVTQMPGWPVTNYGPGCSLPVRKTISITQSGC